MFSRITAIALGLALVLVVATVGHAATIQQIKGLAPWDPTLDYGTDGKLAWDPTATSIFTKFGVDASTITHTGFDPLTGLFDPAGAPQLAAVFQETAPGNPTELKFQTVSSGPGGGGGGGGGGGSTGVITTYELGNDLGGRWRMDFSILFFDAGFTGTGVAVTLTGSGGGDIGGDTLSAAQITNGALVTFDIFALEGETVNVQVESVGDETYAAGFFMDRAVFAVPEPATMALLATGGGLMLLRRRRNK